MPPGETSRTGIRIGISDIGNPDILIGGKMPQSMGEAGTYLPLPASVFTILMVLTEGRCHGYGIKKEVERRSEGQIRLEPGTLYRVIGRLLDDGLIEESWTPGSEENSRRRYYALTTLGRNVVAAEAKRLAVMIDRARAKRLIPTPRSS
jgi:DNA-binding PadR family transcriptional regulator